MPSLPSKQYWAERMVENWRIVENAEELMIKRYQTAYKSLIDAYFELLEPYTTASGIDYRKLEQAIFFNSQFDADLGRYQGLIERIEDIVKSLSIGDSIGIETALMELYSENYYRTAYAISNGVGAQLQFTLLDTNRLKTAVHTKWANDGKEFSSRIWQDKNILAANLRSTIENAIASGESFRVTADRFKDITGNSYYNSKRIVRTEATAIITNSDKDLLTQLGFDQYYYDSTFDSRTSEKCGDMSGNIYYFHDLKIGTNAPPMHPNCRSAITPVNISGYRVKQHIARNAAGKNIKIPSSMTFQQYKKEILGIEPEPTN